MAAELERIASSNKHEMLAYLLAMVKTHASSLNKAAKPGV
jgi:hypothetical protein